MYGVPSANKTLMSVAFCDQNSAHIKEDIIGQCRQKKQMATKIFNIVYKMNDYHCTIGYTQHQDCVPSAMNSVTFTLGILLKFINNSDHKIN